MIWSNEIDRILCHAIFSFFRPPPPPPGHKFLASQCQSIVTAIYKIIEIHKFGTPNFFFIPSIFVRHICFS